MQKNVKKSLSLLSSIVFKIQFQIRTQHVLHNRENKLFHKNSFYINRSLTKNNLENQQDEVISKGINSISLIPTHVELLQKNFNERTFSVTLNTIYHNYKSPLSNESQMDQYLEKIAQIFWNNLGSINHLNTIFTTLRKFYYLDKKISNSYLEKAAEKAFQLMNPLSYKFKDNGSALAMTVKILKKLSLDSTENFGKFNEILLRNHSRVSFFNLLTVFLVLSGKPNVLKDEHFMQYLNFLLFRKEIVTIKNLAKFFECITNYYSFKENQRTCNSQRLHLILQILKELSHIVLIKNQEFSAYECLAYLHLILLFKELGRLIESIKDLAEYNEVGIILDDIWKKSQKKIGNLRLEMIQYPTFLGKCLQLLERHPEPDCLNQDFKKNFIEGLVLYLDIRCNNLLTKENFDIILCYLQKEKDFILQNNLNCSLRPYVERQIKQISTNQLGDVFSKIHPNEEKYREELIEKFFQRKLIMDLQNEIDDL